MVLALISTLLVIGLAMGSLSTLSLQFSRRHLHSTQAEMAARSALNLFLAKARTDTVGKSWEPFNREPGLMSEVFPEPVVLTEGAFKASFHFDVNEEGYSSDNLAGDEPRFGWADTDVPRIPPYGLDLMIKVEGPQGDRYFRAILKRVWPYAMYTGGGSIALMNTVNPETMERRPTVVNGDAFTTWKGGETVAYTVHKIDRDCDFIYEIEEQSGFQPNVPFTKPLHIGSAIRDNRVVDPNILQRTPSTVLYHYTFFKGSVLGAGGDNGVFHPVFTDSGNVLNGNFCYDVKVEANTTPALAGAPGDNIFNGKVIRRRPPAVSPTDSTEFWQTFQSVNFSPIPNESAVLAPSLPMPAESERIDDVTPDYRRFLTQTLRLDESDGTHFVINGSVSNRRVVFHETEAGTGDLYIREMNAGLDLEGVVLHIKGDLDLGATQLEQPIPIRGSRATLIVDGNLIMGNAQFVGMDQGFLIRATNVVFTGGGEFHGMILGANMSIFANADQPLKVNGGLISGSEGGIVLRGIELNYDPKYLKSINGVGDFHLVSWSRDPK